MKKGRFEFVLCRGLFCALFSLIAVLFSCSTRGAPVHGVVLAKAVIDQVNTADSPPGVEAQVYDVLRNELVGQLADIYGADGRIVSKAPLGDSGKVMNLAFDSPSNTLTWSYRNKGDYDINGEVSVSDITPIAIHFLANASDGNGDDALEAWIDGDGSGEVSIGDITPVALGYLNTVTGYKVLTAALPAGPFVQVGSVVTFGAVGVFPKTFSAGLAAGTQGYAAVEPVDASGAPGEMSNIVPLISSNPPAPPTGLAATDGVIGKITLSWTKSSGATGYEIFRDSQVSPIGSVGDTDTWDDTTLGDFDVHTYWLKATNLFGESDFSASDTGFVGELPPPVPPTVQSVSPLGGEEGTPATFTATVLGDAPFTYAWDFGGGAAPNTSTDEFPAVTLGVAGNYSASVVATNSSGSDTFPFVLTVSPVGVNKTPRAALDALPASGDPPLPVTLDASGSSDPDGSIIKYEWDWEGDAIFDYDSGAVSSIQHTYDAPGTYNATVRVTDDKYAWAQAIATVQVATTAKWHIVNVAPADMLGAAPSMAIVDGNPAIAYVDQTGGQALVNYVRAVDANGSVWGVPITVDNGNGHLYTSMLGDFWPAIAYDGLDAHLHYVKAADVDGSSWDAPVTPDPAIGQGQFCSINWIYRDGPGPAYIIPAISYADKDSSGLKWVNVLDRNGNWGTPQKIDSASDVFYTSCIAVAGFPGVVYSDIASGNMKLIRAEDSAGDTWGAPSVIVRNASIGSDRALCAVNEYPAICYEDNVDGNVDFVKALTLDGSAWATPVVLDGGEGGYRAMMAIIGSVPGVCYESGLGDVKFTLASNSDGTRWQTPTTVDSNLGTYGGHPALVNISGMPAVAYFDDTLKMLKYAIYY